MLHTETDALGGVTVYTYNANDMVASIRDPEGHTIYYSYDEEDRVSCIRDANGNLTRYGDTGTKTRGRRHGDGSRPLKK